MFVMPGRFQYLTNPRTGSRTCVEIFRQGGMPIADHYQHHTFPAEIQEELPKIAMIRNPIDTCFSLYYPNWPKTSFEEWMEMEITFFTVINRLVFYDQWTDWYFLYADGIDYMMYHLGIKYQDMPRIGGWAIKAKAVVKKTPERVRMIYDKFGEDLELYHNVLSGDRLWKNAKPIL